jgi:hypothetical protein
MKEKKKRIMNNKNHMECFLADRKRLIGKGTETEQWNQIDYDANEAVLCLPSPQILAAFAGYLKKKLHGKVYFRGEKKHYCTTIPSLYRTATTDDDLLIRKFAFDCLVKKLSTFMKQSRFRQNNFSAALQHYGICSPWVDLVDNIFVALWFGEYESETDYAYIKFFTIDKELIFCDLRKSLTSLSLRPHCQHGISVMGKFKPTLESVDIKKYQVAIVKIPNSKLSSGNACSYLTEEFMFPNEKLDNTLKILKGKKMGKILEEVEDECKIQRGVLGKIK